MVIKLFYSSDTWGVELLKSMGWKPGQGVGPRLTQREKFQAKKELINVGMRLNTYTRHCEDDDDDDDVMNDLFGNINVSPFEYESVAIKPKVDTFGLGYEGLKTTNVTEKSTNKYTKLTVGGKSIHGQVIIIFLPILLIIMLFLYSNKFRNKICRCSASEPKKTKRRCIF